MRLDGSERRIAIGVYAYNEQASISYLLESILNKQRLPEGARVIVVCSGCTDSTVSIVERIASHDQRVELVIEPRRLGVGSAINRILERCTTDRLVLIEADTRPLDDAVYQLAQELEESGAGLIGAWPIIENENKTWVSRGLTFIRRVLLRSLFGLEAFADKTYSNSEFVCIRRRLIDYLPVDIVNPETYVDLHVHAAGYPVLPSRRVRVLVRVPETVHDYLAQRRRIHYGHMQIRRLVGRYASSMEGVVSRRPSLVLSSAVQELRIKPRLVLEIWPALLLDLLAYCCACLDFVRHADHLAWKMIPTTKW